MPTAPGLARLHARRVLAGWRVDESGIEAVELVVSELTTNSVRHACPASSRPSYDELSRVERLSLTLRPFDAGVIVEVYDRNPDMPRFGRASPLDERGRGLALVAAVSTAWGSFPVFAGGRQVGKVTWARCACPSVANVGDGT